MKDLKPVPVTPGILQVVVVLVIVYGLVSAALELWNLNIIPGRLMPGIWASLGMIALWTGFLWLDRRAEGVLKQRLFTAGVVLIVALLAAYSILDRASTAARLASLAFDWSLAGFGAALLLRVRRGRGDEERIS
jgi:hypothetical protein